MTTNDGGSAFPRTADCLRENEDLSGMSLRDWFAGMALQGMLSCQDLFNEMMKLADSKVEARAIVAGEAYKFADAMLAARST